MYNPIWKTVEDKDKSIYVNYANSLYPVDMFNAANSEIYTTQPSFLNRFCLVKLTALNFNPIKEEYFISHGEDFYELDGSHEAIYEICSSDNVLITPNNALEYTRFYFEFVYGEGKRFLLLENDVIFNSLALPDKDRGILSKIFEPLKILKDDNNIFYIGMSVVLDRFIYKLIVKVSSKGVIEIHQERPLEFELSAPLLQTLK